MDVALDVVRNVVVDDVRDALDVEPARRDVGRDDDVELAVLQPLDRAFARRLRHLAAQRRAGEPARLELLAELGRRLASAHEDQHRVEIFGLEDARQRVELVEAAHLDEPLVDRRDRGGLRFDLDLDGVLEVMRDDLANAIRQRRGEERHLLLLGHLAEDALDVLDEAHAQHLVGFVDDDGLELVELQRLAAQVILDAARRADDGVHAAAQLLQLKIHARSAVDGQHVKALEVPGVRLHGLGDLDRELARRREHEQLRLGALHVDAAEQRQRERGRLAGAGLRLTEHVAALEQRRDRGLLDRRRRFVADGAHGREHGFAQA